MNFFRIESITEASVFICLRVKHLYQSPLGVRSPGLCVAHFNRRLKMLAIFIYIKFSMASVLMVVRPCTPANEKLGADDSNHCFIVKLSVTGFQYDIAFGFFCVCRNIFKRIFPCNSTSKSIDGLACGITMRGERREKDTVGSLYSCQLWRELVRPLHNV